MKVYLVGGAVRDKLLGYPIKERDWVVVGSTPAKMKQQGYKQVGRDFPIFLHPNTREEYALARTERKSGVGYYGFTCDFNPHVTLEEDLARRDLTINAIALEDTGQLIDPYHGQDDLQARVLRHVSASFAEDPVRVLRVARFAARFHHLGFKLADETRALMYAMVKRGELSYLVPERVWREWSSSLQEKNPQIFISTLRSCGALHVILPEIDTLFGIPGSPIHHPEIDTGIHTLMAQQVATVLSDDPMVRFAVLLHDLGKALTPVAQWPSHPEHEAGGVPIVEALCLRLRIPVDYRKLAQMAARFHLTIHCLYSLDAEAIVNLFEQTDAFRNPHRFEKLVTVCEADARGVGKEVSYPQADDWRGLLNECLSIEAKEWVAKGYQGEAIKTALHDGRVAHINTIWITK
jgi:tRNA nucleotidyltransferase (CCA-adding enzyme)